MLLNEEEAIVKAQIHIARGERPRFHFTPPVPLSLILLKYYGKFRMRMASIPYRIKIWWKYGHLG